MEVKRLMNIGIFSKNLGRGASIDDVEIEGTRQILVTPHCYLYLPFRSHEGKTGAEEVTRPMPSLG